jgi:hypothetical protein
VFYIRSQVSAARGEVPRHHAGGGFVLTSRRSRLGFRLVENDAGEELRGIEEVVVVAGD